MRCKFITLLFTLSPLLFVGCVSQSRQLGISDQEWQSMSPNLHNYLTESAQKIKQQNALPTVVYAGPILNISLSGGKALMPPFVEFYAFRATRWTMQPGQCSAVRLNGVDGQHYTLLRACYNGVTLTIDPSRYDLDKSQGSVRFDYNSLWKRGFTYSHVVTSGYVWLQNSNLSIKTVSKNSQPLHD